MATAFRFSPLCSICFSCTHSRVSITCPSLALRNVPISTLNLVPLKAQRSKSKSHSHRIWLTQAVQEEAQIQVQEDPSSPVVVPISPSDILTMYFQAEGTINEAAVPSLTKALEETEGVASLKIQVVEGIASVELQKQTTVQATGVASGLVETIQGSGFKLQTLNLSFDDEEDAAA